ncbi:hypothetical protein PIB30_079109 [Stylosanthes scabra]|uniref:Uncharacterized protein n=1 Tax=Stylosanthes scabra TaxID=79078 RepID=A0ABU6WQR0_9FABA|nr:hypothetical protein [Stylosanthes scabra]
MGNNPSCYAQDYGLDLDLSMMWEGRVAWAYQEGVDEGRLMRTAPRAPRDGQQRGMLCPSLGARHSTGHVVAAWVAWEHPRGATPRAVPNARLVLAQARGGRGTVDADGAACIPAMGNNATCSAQG